MLAACRRLQLTSNARRPASQDRLAKGDPLTGKKPDLVLARPAIAPELAQTVGPSSAGGATDNSQGCQPLVRIHPPHPSPRRGRQEVQSSRNRSSNSTSCNSNNRTNSSSNGISKHCRPCWGLRLGGSPGAHAPGYSLSRLRRSGILLLKDALVTQQPYIDDFANQAPVFRQ